MIQLIEDKRQEIERLCIKYSVARLDLFGSAASKPASCEAADVDLLVQFLPSVDARLFDMYFGFLEDLEALFGRSVDLVVDRAIRNPYFRKAVDESRRLLYAA